MLIALMYIEIEGFKLDDDSIVKAVVSGYERRQNCAERYI